MSSALILLFVVVGGVLALKFALRPHTAIVVGGGTARLRRGSAPNALISDLQDLARGAPHAQGEVLISGRAPNVEVQVRGVDEALAQRIRNVVGLHRARLR
jgi:hypothetical protein